LNRSILPRLDCLAFFLIFILIRPLLADTTVYTTVELPDPLQDVGHSPRAAALASAYTASEGTVDSLDWNPAGMASISDPQLSLNHQSWFGDLYRENIMAAIPFSKAGVLGLGVDYTGYGTLQGFNTSGDPTQTYQPYRVSLSLGWAFPFLPNLFLGAAGTGLLDFQSSDYQNISEFLTAGFLWKGLPPIQLGASYSFANSSAPIEMGLLKIGASCPQTFMMKNPTLFLVDLSLPPHGVYSLQAGVEQTLWSDFFARIGYAWEWTNNYITGFRGLTAGLGIRWEEWRLDYAFIPNGDLGSSQTVGLSYFFPQAPTPKSAAPEPGAAFKPAKELLPGDRVVNVEVNLTLPKDATPLDTGPVQPELAEKIKNLVQVVAQDPKNAGHWDVLGNLYWQAGRPSYAVQCFEEVLQLQPSNQALKDWLEKYKNIRSNTGTGKE